MILLIKQGMYSTKKEEEREPKQNKTEQKNSIGTSEKSMCFLQESSNKKLTAPTFGLLDRIENNLADGDEC